MKKKYKKKLTNVKLVGALAIILIIVIQLLINVFWFDYWHGNVKLTYESDVEQCKMALDNFRDIESDLINYERTNTDKMSFSIPDDIKRCLILEKTPERFIRGAYGHFWLSYIIGNIILLAAFILIIRAIYSKIADNIKEESRRNR